MPTPNTSNLPDLRFMQDIDAHLDVIRDRDGTPVDVKASWGFDPNSKIVRPSGKGGAQGRRRLSVDERVLEARGAGMLMLFYRATGLKDPSGCWALDPALVVQQPNKVITNLSYSGGASGFIVTKPSRISWVLAGNVLPSTTGQVRALVPICRGRRTNGYCLNPRHMYVTIAVDGRVSTPGGMAREFYDEAYSISQDTTLSPLTYMRRIEFTSHSPNPHAPKAESIDMIVSMEATTLRLQALVRRLMEPAIGDDRKLWQTWVNAQVKAGLIEKGDLK